MWTNNIHVLLLFGLSEKAALYMNQWLNCNRTMIDFVVTWLDSTDEEYEIINRELQRMLEQKFPSKSSFEK